MRAAGEDEVLVAAGLIVVTGHYHRARVRGRSAIHEPLRVERLGAAMTVGDELRQIPSVSADQPGELKHFTEGHAAEVQLETGDYYVVPPLQEALGEEKKIADELAFVS